MTSDTLCRLCGGPTERQFSLRVLDRHDSAYWRCARCASLQTDVPTWLDEAYATSLSFLDTFAAQRTLNNLAASFLTARCLGLSNVVDFGGSDGILCRLLRDYGLNCFVRDKYAQPKYAQGFDAPDFAAPDLTLAFEVLEHLPRPQVDLDEIFAGHPPVLLASTQRYVAEGATWTYLAPETGQHVFFYSERALDMIAAERGYRLLRGGAYLLFVRPERMVRARLVCGLFQRHSLRLLRVLMNLLPAGGVMSDFERLRAGYRARAAPD